MKKIFVSNVLESQMLKLSIKKKTKSFEDTGFNYDIKIGDWTLGRGVTELKLDMKPTSKPKLTILAQIDLIDADIDALTELGLVESHISET